MVPDAGAAKVDVEVRVRASLAHETVVLHLVAERIVHRDVQDARILEANASAEASYRTWHLVNRLFFFQFVAKMRLWRR